VFSQSLLSLDIIEKFLEISTRVLKINLLVLNDIYNIIFLNFYRMEAIVGKKTKIIIEWTAKPN